MPGLIHMPVPVPNLSPEDQLQNAYNSGWADNALNAPASNYAAAFDPSSTQYSVNTGNATNRTLETLSSVFSTPPTNDLGSAANATGRSVLIGIGLFALYFLTKGKFK